MLNYTEHDKSFEYNPIQTEMGYYNQNNSRTSSKGNSSFQYSQLRNEQIEEEVSNCASLYSKKQNESIESLYSLRVSHSISNLRDNERTLLERMNLLHSISVKQEEEDENENRLQKYNNPKKKIYLENVFDCSSTDNKSVMISELDIEITNTTVYKAKNKDDKSNYDKYNTVKCSPNHKTKKFFYHKDKREGNNANITNQSNPCSNITKCIEKKSCSTQNKDKKEIDFINKKHLNSNASDLIKKTTYLTKHNEKINNKNTEKGIKKKKKRICSSMKKINDKKSIFHLLNRVFIDDPRVSSLTKKTATTSTISTIANALPQSTSSKIKLLNSNNIITYTGKSNNSTASQEGSKKRSNNIPLSNLQKNTKIPHVKSFNHQESLIQKRIFSLNQKNYSQKELRMIPQIKTGKRDYSLKMINKKSSNMNSFIVKDLHPSKSKGKQLYSTNGKEFSTRGIMNIQINAKGNSNVNNNNCQLFNTIQSISDDKIKCPHTVSTRKNKQIYTNQYLVVKSNCNSKEKRKENQSPQSTYRSVNNRNAQVYSNKDYTTTQQNQNDNGTKNNNNKTQLQIPFNLKSNVQVYKNNIKHITITPINGLKIKMMELQQHKNKIKGKNKDEGKVKNKKKGHIENNEDFFHKLLTEH